MSGAVTANNDCLTTGDFTPEHRAYFDKFSICCIVAVTISHKYQPFFSHNNNKERLSY